MMNLALAFIGGGVVWISLAALAAFERQSRLAPVLGRPELRPRRAEWGGSVLLPSSEYAVLRGLAEFARLVRSRSVVAERATLLGSMSRSFAVIATVTAFSLIPFAGTWGGASDGMPMVVADVQFGLGFLGVLMLLAGVAVAANGLSERSFWSRLGALRIATESLLGVALFFLVLAPLILATSSLRLHEIATLQQIAFTPHSILVRSWASLGLNESGFLASIHLPGWFVIRQPLTALLMIPTLNLLLRRPTAYDRVKGMTAVSGLGLDADPGEAYGTRLEARLALVLGAALFVTLFLGASDIPYVDPEVLVGYSETFIGPSVPAAFLLLIEAGVFVAKLVVVLAGFVFLQRSTVRARADQSIRLMTRRLIPLAWANLVLVAAIELSSGAGGLE